MECRTHQKRIEIINKYYVIPIEHNIIINGGYIKGNAGKDLKNEYYKFITKNKFNINDMDTIICGNFVAKDFANILKIKLPAVFSIFIDENIESNNNQENNSTNNVKWNITNKQLYNAIRIIMLKYNIKPYSPLYKIYLETINHKNIINKTNIKSCNTILSKLNKNNPKTLQEIINEFIKKNPDKTVRSFNFDKLTDYLVDNKIEINSIYLK